MIPLALVTGFLGSGKTTFLQRLVERYRERRMVYLINEFSPINVDGKLLDLPADKVVGVAGGSIFCRCLVTEFIGCLQRIAEGEPGAPDGVIIEASGIANPKVIQQMLAETRLDQLYQLRTIVTVVDPGSFHDLLEALPNIAAQIQSADVALINKVDQYPQTQVAATEAALDRIRPGIKSVRTRFADADIDVFALSVQRTLAGDYALCSDPNYVTTSVRLRESISLTSLIKAIDELGPAVFRVKGFVPTADGVKYLDVSHAGVNISSAPQAALRQLVVIGRGDARDRIESFVDEIIDGVYGVASA